MKIKLVLYTILLCLPLKGFAQVGINTTAPQGVFHIDPLGNTVGSSGDSDDIIVTKDGKVGIGTVSPQATVDLRGKFRLVDGTQANGRYLTTDANGYATWKPDIEIKTTKYGTTATPDLTSVSPIYTGSYISLPAGKWMIAFTCTYKDLNPNPNFIVWRLSTSNTSLVPYLNNAKSTAYSCSAKASYHTSVSCYFLVDATTPKTYYLWAQINKASTLRYTGEKAFYAVSLS